MLEIHPLHDLPAKNNRIRDDRMQSWAGASAVPLREFAGWQNRGSNQENAKFFEEAELRTSRSSSRTKASYPTTI